MARVRLEPFGSGRIYPHEETLAGPKADRLELFQATEMNLSPVFGLYPDPDDGVMKQLQARVGRSLPLQATDHLGVVSRLWPVTDQHVVSAVTGALGPKPVFIADGHHRYETGLRYLQERRAAGETDPAAASSILMMLVSMSDPGLIILPTHRIVSGFPALDADKLASILGKHFQTEKIGIGEKGARDAWESIEADGGQDLLGFCTSDDGVWQTARLRAPEAMAVLAPDHSPAWRGLAVSILHVAGAGSPPAGGVGRQSGVQIRPSAARGDGRGDATEGRLVALVPPATMAHVEQIAGNLEKMPPKSTYFYPKLLSGLVFNPLKGN